MAEVSWVESLGFLKDFEVRRRARFAEWLEAFRGRLQVERRKASSAQLLVAQVKAQLKERAELDEEVSKRLRSFASRALARPEDWSCEDLADADFLSSVQLDCAQQLAEVSRSFKVLLENSEPFKDLEAVSREGFKTILLAEQLLREAEAKDADCLSAWQKHEALCKKHLETQDLTGLWSSEVAYRRSVAKFGDVSEAAHQKAAGLTRKLREEGERFRALSKRILSDVAACMASCYNTLARTANEASPYRQPSAALELPRLPDWERPVPPETALMLKQGTVERQQGLLRHWRSCHLLLTKEGSVHCYDGLPEASGPVWSGRPGEGASLRVDTAARTLSLYPAREWLKQRWRLTLRVATLEELLDWEQQLGSHWRQGPEVQEVQEVPADAERPWPTEPAEGELGDSPEVSEIQEITAEVPDMAETVAAQGGQAGAGHGFPFT